MIHYVRNWSAFRRFVFWQLSLLCSSIIQSNNKWVSNSMDRGWQLLHCDRPKKKFSYLRGMILVISGNYVDQGLGTIRYLATRSIRYFSPFQKVFSLQVKPLVSLLWLDQTFLEKRMGRKGRGLWPYGVRGSWEKLHPLRRICLVGHRDQGKEKKGKCMRSRGSAGRPKTPSQ